MQRDFVRDGHVGCTTADRGELWIAGDGRDAKPVLSPDGRLIAFVRETARTASGGDRSADVMVFDPAGGAARKLTAATSIDPSDEPVGTLTWSLDGGFPYALVGAYVTTDEIVQLGIADGRRRTVIDGNSLAVKGQGEDAVAP